MLFNSMSKRSMQISWASFQSAALFVLLGLAGCGYAPPLPPPLDLADYRRHIDMTLEEPGEDARVGILGARLARGGLYLDLVVHAKSGGTSEQSVVLGQLIAMEVSNCPEERIEMTDIEERPIRVYPVRRPYKPMFFTTGSCVFWAQPPTYQVDDHRLIQVCMFRTARQLRPGVYRVRFSDRWKTDEAAWARPLSYEWEQVEVDWPAAGSEAE